MLCIVGVIWIKSENFSYLLSITFIYEGKVKISQPILHETQDKWPLGRELDRGWCHCHTTVVVKLFGLQPMLPWASAASYGQGESFRPSLKQM